MSLQALPQSVLRIIVEYVTDVETLCSLDSTCRDLHDVTREEAVWVALWQRTWQRGSALCGSAREEFKRRYLIDNEVMKYVSRLNRTTEQLPMLYAVSQVMSNGCDAMDICWRLWKCHKNQETRKYARGFLRLLLCGSVCADMKRTLNDEDNTDRTPGERLEDACILTTTMFQPVSCTNFQDTAKENVKVKLQQIADSIKIQFTSEMSIKTKLKIVDEAFFHQEHTCFSGNVQNYYDYRNSLLDVSLDRRKAIPMTLALLYKFICHRLDILVEVVGLPGHIVVHVPALARFVDVFEGGRHLSVADCINIVNQYGFPMQDSYLSPLPPELIVQRILNNLENCLVRNPSIQRPASARQRAAITALRAVASEPNSEQLDECRHLLVLTWTSEACVGTDISDW